jgi:hypothetical protein
VDAANRRALQAFAVPDPGLWARYVRVDLDSHHGHAYYCPLTVLRVHGTTMMEDYQDDLRAWSDRPPDDGGGSSSGSSSGGSSGGDGRGRAGSAAGVPMPACLPWSWCGVTAAVQLWLQPLWAPGPRAIERATPPAVAVLAPIAASRATRATSSSSRSTATTVTSPPSRRGRAGGGGATRNGTRPWAGGGWCAVTDAPLGEGGADVPGACMPTAASAPPPWRRWRSAAVPVGADMHDDALSEGLLPFHDNDDDDDVDHPLRQLAASGGPPASFYKTVTLRLLSLEVNTTLAARYLEAQVARLYQGARPSTRGQGRRTLGEGGGGPLTAVGVVHLQGSRGWSERRRRGRARWTGASTRSRPTSSSPYVGPT